MDLAALLSQLLSQIPPAIEAPYDSGLLLIAFALRKPKTWVLANPDYQPNPEEIETIRRMQTRLLAGEPLPYILNFQEFYGLPFFVSPAVLIPRPETELMVDLALDWLKAHPTARRALDVGSGSGCLAVTLAYYLPGLTLTAVDISADALAVSQHNARTNQVDQNIIFLQSDLLENVSGTFNLLCANLPYIPTAKLPTVNSLPYEPLSALDGGEDGLLLIRKFLHQTPTHLAPPYLILLEIEETTALLAITAARSAFPSAQIQLYQDLAGKDRLISISG